MLCSVVVYSMAVYSVVVYGVVVHAVVVYSVVVYSVVVYSVVEWLIFLEGFDICFLFLCYNMILFAQLDKSILYTSNTNK